jgi:CubicO group peptidase (beta-lactamase class C family)
LSIEKRATIDHLITARSGVYHDASNGGDDAANRPPRGSKEPGTYFLYNNWDFNAAGAVFEQLTGQDIYKAFQEQIALPTGLQDYNVAEQRKSGNLNASRFPAYHFHFSARDMARIGYLMLRNGKWGSTQVISPEWVSKIISVVTPLEEVPPSRMNMFEYGYMWWLFKVEDPAFKGAYSARGAMGQFITVLPALDMVVVFKTDSVYERTTTWNQYYTLLRKIAGARVTD